MSVIVECLKRLGVLCASDGCRSIRSRRCYGFCRPCWADGLRRTWESIWWDTVETPASTPSALPDEALGEKGGGR